MYVTQLMINLTSSFVVNLTQRWPHQALFWKCNQPINPTEAEELVENIIPPWLGEAKHEGPVGLLQTLAWFQIGEIQQLKIMETNQYFDV